MMKKSIYVVLLLAFSFIANAQTGRPVDGNLDATISNQFMDHDFLYRGIAKYRNSDGEVQNAVFYFRVSSDGSFLVICDENGDDRFGGSGISDNLHKETTVYNNRAASITWFNTNGIWTEIQTFHIVTNDEDEDGDLKLTWARTVTNRNGSAFAMTSFFGWVEKWLYIGD